MKEPFEKVSTFIGYLSLFVAFIFIAAGFGVYLYGNPSTVITTQSFAIDFSNKASLSSF